MCRQEQRHSKAAESDKKSDGLATIAPVLALPIFPGRHQPSIFGRDELNYRVRNGNGWTLILISTNYSSVLPKNKLYYTIFLRSVKSIFIPDL